MKIAIVGTGYVGLVTGACFSEMGTTVTCIDVDEEKIAGLNRGVIPIYEPGLQQMVERNAKAKRLFFSTSLSEILNDQDVVFCAVGTPPMEDGSADLRSVLDVAREIGRVMDKYILIVTKSTVPVGTAKKIEKAIREEQKRRDVSVPFDVASNPEFLKEGDALSDFMRPDRIVVGVDSRKAKELMEELYQPFTLNGHPLLFMNPASAELSKYAANAMLATRISFMNEIANLCEFVGADFNSIRRGIGSDPRIGSMFLYAGCGYGGSCFPKDVKALCKTAEEHGLKMRVIDAVEEVNRDQKMVLFNKVKSHFEKKGYASLEGMTIAVWGLSFKPETDDMREAPSLTIINSLLLAGCKVRVYDPIAMEEAKKYYLAGQEIAYAPNMYEAARGADAILIVTEWKEFRFFNAQRLKEMLNGLVIFDGRNIYNPKVIRSLGFDYHYIGGK